MVKINNVSREVFNNFWVDEGRMAKGERPMANG